MAARAEAWDIGGCGPLVRADGGGGGLDGGGGGIDGGGKGLDGGR